MPRQRCRRTRQAGAQLLRPSRLRRLVVGCWTLGVGHDSDQQPTSNGQQPTSTCNWVALRPCAHGSARTLMGSPFVLLRRFAVTLDQTEEIALTPERPLNR